ncbi:MAG: HlyC/CorC family transporter [Gammaproteobacteria bacterium]|uniref:HlyC/CorC family transporter n=1 Tax=Pseudomaricurvus alcaniphilus TaxID=1166482 RepID=UPI00140D7652|nr:HlyC/CorC family transporter [Pseudomaricurvus alcaniphilus]MBR9910385.1 HlyC/CorC family transporter [Gammaproteobacteria bacterium]NHN36204.1 HlyC/CorC family transporter [Pseudomaricurvus alcaniphilus]
MNDAHLGLLFGILAVLILLSGFFSSSETGMMSLNRYRLKHLAKKKHRGAMRAADLLERPDRLIGVILIGNNLVNNFAAALTTVIAIRLYGEGAVFAASIILTLVVLIFSEVTPKTIAALHPEKIAFPASILLKPLLFLFYPLVWVVNSISNALARMLGVDPSKTSITEHLRPEELRTVVDEHGDLIPDQHQGMLLNVLDLEKATVEDIMIPRNEVYGLDLEDDIGTLLKRIRSSDYTRLPVYSGDINNIVGVLHLRNASRFIYGKDDSVSHDAIRRFTREPYFVPEGTPLHTQLMQFQQQKRRMAIVVDEFGDVQGIVTMEDLLEEIVGDFTTNLAEEEENEISPMENEWFLIEGGTSIRDINRQLGWDLPTDGPKTLNGLMIEFMENIPAGNIGFQIERYRFETVELSDKMIECARVKQVAWSQAQ